MAHTNSLAFPSMFNVAQNSVAVLEDDASVVSRSRLLILTEPTELYNDPLFGVGLRRYIWQYNTDNTKAIIQSRIREQLRTFEPCVNADNIQFADGLLYSGSEDEFAQKHDHNHLKMTIKLETTYSEAITFQLNDCCEEVTINE